jgi:hypothetical protein
MGSEIRAKVLNSGSRTSLRNSRFWANVDFPATLELFQLEVDLYRHLWAYSGTAVTLKTVHRDFVVNTSLYSSFLIRQPVKTASSRQVGDRNYRNTLTLANKPLVATSIKPLALIQPIDKAQRYTDLTTGIDSAIPDPVLFSGSSALHL